MDRIDMLNTSILILGISLTAHLLWHMVVGYTRRKK